MTTAIRFEGVSKQYRLGEVGTGTLSYDLARVWAKVWGKPDPFSQVGSTNGPLSSNSDDWVWALKDVTFDIQQGEILGIIGRNGAGKSTLLKLLSRVTAPTQGCIKAKGRIASLLEVGTGFHPELTGRENVYLNGVILGMKREEITNQFDEIVEFSGCGKYIDTPVRRYSSGMMVRLGFAVAAHLRCEILVVDEVLAVGDAEFQKKCLNKLDQVSHSQGRTILFVSHNMGAIAQLCSRCVSLDKGELSFQGSVTKGIANYLDGKRGDPKQLPINESSEGSFLSIATEDERGKETESFMLQQSICSRIRFQLREKKPGLEIGMNIYSRTGTLVFCSERSQTDRSELTVGENAFHVTIPAGFLAPGSYTATLVAHVPNQEIIDVRESATSFRVEETGSHFSQYHGINIGLVLCNCQWRRPH